MYYKLDQRRFTRKLANDFQQGDSQIPETYENYTEEFESLLDDYRIRTEDGLRDVEDYFNSLPYEGKKNFAVYTWSWAWGPNYGYISLEDTRVQKGYDYSRSEALSKIKRMIFKELPRDFLESIDKELTEEYESVL